MEPQVGAIGQAMHQLNPRGETAMKDMVTGRRPFVPMEDRVRLMEQMRAQLGDQDMNKLIESLLMQEAPRLGAQQGGIKEMLQMLQTSGVMGGPPHLGPQEMLHEMRRKK